MLIFSFRVRAGRLSFVDLFFPHIDVASHVFVVSVMCILKKVNPRKRPSTELSGLSPTGEAAFGARLPRAVLVTGAWAPSGWGSDLA